MADWSGVPLRRLLLSAERLSETAICRGLRLLKTFDSRSSASLCFVTLADQRLLLRLLFLAGFFLSTTSCFAFRSSAGFQIRRPLIGLSCRHGLEDRLRKI